MITRFNKYNLITENNYFDRYNSIIVLLKSEEEIKKAIEYIDNTIGDILDNYVGDIFLDGVLSHYSRNKTPYIRYNTSTNRFSYGTLEYLQENPSDYYTFKKYYHYSDLKYVVNLIKNGGDNIPDYKPKKFIYESKNYFNEYKSIPIILRNIEDVNYAYTYIRDHIDRYLNRGISSDIKNGAIGYINDGRDAQFLYYYPENRFLYGSVDGLDRGHYNFEKFYTIGDLNKIKNIIKNKGEIIPDYKPKQFVYENNSDLLLEKSSLTKLGVPREVMQPIQRDFALSPNVEWEKIKHKKDIVDYLRKGDKNLFIQIAIDSIKVIVSYPTLKGTMYFIDNYVYRDTGWSGEYEKLPRQYDTLTQTVINIDPRTNIYRLIGDFSVNKQSKRKMIKKEKSFMEFSEKFKTDFLQKFDSILKRITGTNFKKAKKEVTDKAKRVAIENNLLIKGLDNPLNGPNGLSILDEFLLQFEEAYSKYFEERIDIQELIKYFSYEKVMTMFMYYIMTNSIMK
jgi:hypothetical protein